MGYDPDDVDEDIIKNYIAGAQALGENALEEVAAHSSQRGDGLHIVRATDLGNIARREGFGSSGKNAVRLSQDAQDNVPKWGEMPAWQVGKAAAEQLRTQEKFELDPIQNNRLAELAGTHVKAITSIEKHFDEFSFVINNDAKAPRVCAAAEVGNGTPIRSRTVDRGPAVPHRRKSLPCNAYAQLSTEGPTCVCSTLP